MLVVHRPFRHGDFIEVNGNLGTVLEIGLFSTKIRTVDNKHVIIPNGTLTNSTIINYSSEELRRVDMVVSAAYGTDIEKVKQVILKYAEGDAQILKDPAPVVRMKDMSTSSIDFTVRVWVENKDYWDVRFNLSENIYTEFFKNGIEIPFNQLDVHVK
jgi:small conductance mechanosensitive channel